jgi:hypothetical protein
MVHKLAGYHHGKPYVAKRVPKSYRARLMRHQRTFKSCRAKGMSRTASIREARRAEHRGMNKRQIRSYEGRLGAIARS